MQASAVALGCPQEPLLLMTLQTLVIEHRKIKLSLTRKCLPCWLAFTAAEGAM